MSEPTPRIEVQLDQLDLPGLTRAEAGHVAMLLEQCLQRRAGELLQGPSRHIDLSRVEISCDPRSRLRGARLAEHISEQLLLAIQAADR